MLTQSDVWWIVLIATLVSAILRPHVRSYFYEIHKLEERCDRLEKKVKELEMNQ